MSTPSSTVIVRADFLAAIQPFISTEETRYYLNGVFIEPHPVKGALLVVTDGHTMAVIHDEEATVIGPSRIWKMDWSGLLRSISKERKDYKFVTAPLLANLHCPPDGKPSVQLTIEHIELVSKTSTDLVIDGTFPEWRRVVPRTQEEGVLRPQFQPAYVTRAAAFGTALTAACDKVTISMEIVPMSTNGPAIVRYSNLPNAFVVIMPMRGDAMEAGPPSQVLELPPQEMAEAA